MFARNTETTGRRFVRLAFAVLVLLAFTAPGALGADVSERFPPPDFETDYSMPETVLPPAGSDAMGILTIVILVAALSLATLFIHRWRKRTAVIGLSVFALLFFGFVRKGCICPIGSIQHVSVSLFGTEYSVPLLVALLFALPLVFALLFGRVFCAGVCPLGAVQDLVLIKPVRLPAWLVAGLSMLPILYIGLAVLYAVNGTGFFICRYDPFVGFFRLSGPAVMLAVGGLFVVASTFIGRPYCRFLCPYAVLLSLCSRWSWRQIKTTPDDCIVCGLCEDACPFGAIEPPTPQGVEE